MLELAVIDIALLGFVLRAFIWLFAIVKIIEIVQYLWWTLTKGSKYRDKLLACLKHGLPVKNLFDYLEAGDSLDQFLHSFPSVSKEQAVAALELAREALVLDAHPV